jgi:hypothetical protein
MADAKHVNPHCPECETELSGPDAPVLKVLRLEYRVPREHPQPEPRPVDAIFCPSCGRLFTLLAHPGVA